MRIYTRGGDRGETSLYRGKRVAKDSPQVSAFGSIDELNSALGLVRAHLKTKEIESVLEQIQQDLFFFGSQLSGSNSKIDWSKKTRELENIIDRFDSKLPPLKNFILPSGTKASSFLHLSRAIARRAERNLVSLAKLAKIDQNLLPYLNRLSDLLFVLARYENKKNSISETLWEKERG